MIKRGFTLIELLVSTAVFTIVMVIALGALLSLSEANRKADILNSSVNNLSFALDSMSRSLRTGTNYHCTSGGVDLDDPLDCGAGGPSGTTPGTYIAFLSADKEKIAYCYDATAKVVKRQVIPAGSSSSLSTSCSSSSFLPLTMPEVTVTNLSFYVTGAETKNSTGNTVQPKVTILLNAYVSVKATQKSLFNLQTTVTQRIYDL